MVWHAWLSDHHGGVIDLAWPEHGSVYFGVPVPARDVGRVMLETGLWAPVLDVLVPQGWLPIVDKPLTGAALVAAETLD